MTSPQPVSFPRLRARTQRFTLGEPRSVTVCADGNRVLFLRSAAGDDSRTGLWVLDLADRRERAVVAPSGDGELSAAERARRERVRESASGITSYAADAAGRVVTFVVDGELHVADVDRALAQPDPPTGVVRRIDGTAGCFDPRPDPTGTTIAYVSGRRLKVVGVDGSADRVIAGVTSELSGSQAAIAYSAPDNSAETVSWGRAEFVAAEEMDRHRGFWWSPTGDVLLAARVDEAPVPQWWIADPAHPDQPPRPVRYPAAGTANADVSLWLLGLGGDRREVCWDHDRLPYLAQVSWTSAGPPLVTVVSRDQRQVQMLTVEPTTGETAVVAEQVSDTWVDLVLGVPAWLDGELVRTVDEGDTRRLLVGEKSVTPPSLRVRSVVAVTDDAVLLTASEDDPTQVRVLRWAGSGGLQPVTDTPGVHTATAAGGTTVVSSADLDHDGTRAVVRPARGEPHTLASYALSPQLRPEVRMLTLGPRELRAGLLLPRGHVAGRRLPVIMDPYAGPHAQRVLSARRSWLEPQWLADQGFAVLVVDGRGTPGRGPAWERAVHLDLAGPVLDDQVEALEAAAAIEPDLDLERVGIRGWSFGGYLAALAVLRRPDVFAAAVAGAPVTDMALYDTFYTERYLGTPAEQPDAYRRCSLLEQAASLTRPLMLVHGLADDNVVAAHTLRLSQRLTEAGRPHTVLPLTGVTHMAPQETVAENLLLLQVEFLSRHLAAPG